MADLSAADGGIQTMKVMVIERLRAGRTSALGDMMGEGSVSEKYAPASFRCMAGTSYGDGANALAHNRLHVVEEGCEAKHKRFSRCLIEHLRAPQASEQLSGAQHSRNALHWKIVAHRPVRLPGNFLPAIGASDFLGGLML